MIRSGCAVTNLKYYLLIKEAAQFLGVSAGTLRNWERVGKIPTHRHPLNGYRLYRTADLRALLKATHRSAARLRSRSEKEVAGSHDP
jgi:DNA (cytosine-5)-methyltransferase 1